MVNVNRCNQFIVDEEHFFFDHDTLTSGRVELLANGASKNIGASGLFTLIALKFQRYAVPLVRPEYLDLSGKSPLVQSVTDLVEAQGY